MQRCESKQSLISNERCYQLALLSLPMALLNFSIKLMAKRTWIYRSDFGLIGIDSVKCVRLCEVCCLCLYSVVVTFNFSRFFILGTCSGFPILTIYKHCILVTPKRKITTQRRKFLPRIRKMKISLSVRLPVMWRICGAMEAHLVWYFFIFLI